MEDEIQVNISDFISVYGDQSNDNLNFTRDLNAKREFNSLDRPGDYGNLRAHQVLISRAAGPKTPWKKFICYWALGQGKTRAGVELVHQYVDVSKQYGTNVNSLKPLIIVEGKPIADVWRSEFIKTGRYNINIKAGSSAAKRESAITSALNKVVEIIHWTMFAKRLQKITDDAIIDIRTRLINIFMRDQKRQPNATELADLIEQANKQGYDYADNVIRREYDRPLVIIDEVQELKSADYIDTDDNSMPIIRKKLKENKTLGVKMEVIQGKLTMLQMTRYLKLIPDATVVLLTGTPMIKSSKEIASIINFILPTDVKQVSIDKINRYIDNPKKLRRYLAPFLNGRVSHIRQAKTNAKLITDFELQILPSKAKVVSMAIQKDRVEEVQENKDIEENKEDGGSDEESIEKEFYFVKVIPTILGKKQQKLYEKAVEEMSQYKITKEGEKRQRHPFKGGVFVTQNSIFLDDKFKADSGLPMDKSFDKFVKIAKFDGSVISTNKTNGKIISTDKTSDKKRVKTKSTGKTSDKKGIKVATKKKEIPDSRKIFNFAFNIFESERPELKHDNPLPADRLEVIRQMSGKFAKIAEIIHYNHDSEGKKECAFIFCNYVRSGGAIPLGLALQALGYDIFSVRGNYNGPIDFSIEGINNIKKPRIVFLTGPPSGSDSTTQKNVILQLLNHPDNRYGEYISVVIGSKTVFEGVSFLNVRQFHALGPSFRSLRQALGRPNRLNSHLAFPESERYIKIYYHAAYLRPKFNLTTNTDEIYKFSIEETTEIFDIDNKPIMPYDLQENQYVKINYKKGFVTSIRVINKDDITSELKKGEYVGTINPRNIEDGHLKMVEGIDVQIYVDREEEDIQMRTIERIMKEMAFDCKINAYSNLRADEEDYTPESDYQKAMYKCIGIDKDYKGRELVKIPEDLSTYHLFYATQEKALIEEKIRRIFTLKNIWNVNTLIENITKNPSIIRRKYGDSLYNDDQIIHHPQTVLLTITEMIFREDIVQDNFGYFRYLRQNNDIIFLSDIINNYTNNKKQIFDTNFYNYHDVQYVNNLNLNIQHDILIESDDRLDELKAMTDVTIEDFDEKWNELQSKIKILLLEEALINGNKFKSQQVAEKIREYYNFAWFVDNKNKLIFHYVEYMSNVTAKCANPYQIKYTKIQHGKIKFRIFNIDGDDKFRYTTIDETEYAVRIINKSWLDRENDMMEKGCGKYTFVCIRNRTADDQYRFKTHYPPLSKTGKPDLRHAAGEAETTIKEIKTWAYLWQIDPESIPRIMRKKFANMIYPPDELLREIVAYTLNTVINITDPNKIIPIENDDDTFGVANKIDVTDWTDDKLKFTYIWLTSNKMITEGYYNILIGYIEEMDSELENLDDQNSKKGRKLLQKRNEYFALFELLKEFIEELKSEPKDVPNKNDITKAKKYIIKYLEKHNCVLYK